MLLTELVQSLVAGEKANLHLQLAQDGVARACEFLRELQRMARHDVATAQLIDVESTVMSALNLTRDYVTKRAQLISESTSKVGHGARFGVRLPAADPTANAALYPAVHGAPDEATPSGLLR